MGVTETSKLAFESIRPKLSDHQRIVLQAIKVLGTANDIQISQHVNWPINMVTNRRGELAKKELIEVAFRGKNERGYLVHFWRAVKNEEMGVCE